MAGIKFDITGDNRNVLQSFGEVQSGVKQMQRQVEDSGASIEDMFKRIGAAAGIAFSFQEAKAFVGKVVEMRSFFQDIESSMKVFLGNEKKAAEFTQQLKDYAYYNMFEFKDLADASQQMIAYGHDIDTIIPKLDQLSNIAVGTHGNLMDLVAIYNKAKSTGVVDAQGIQSWAVKGVVIKDVLKQMGEEASGTAVTFEQLNKVLDHVTGEGGMFHDLQLEMMENISAEIGQFEDNFNAMLNEIGEKYQDTIISGIKIGSEIIDNYQTLAKYIQDAVVAYGLYKTALMTANALDKARTVGLFALTTAEKVHYGALVLEEKAQALLNKTIMANPYVLATMAVAGLAFGIYKLATAEDAETAARRRANEQMDEFKGKLEEQKSRITSYIQTVQDANATDYEKALAWENLSKEAPTLTNAYTQAEVAAMDFGDAQKHINDIMDEAEYSQTIQQVKQWEAEVKKANDALNAFGGGGLIEKLTKVFQEKDLNAAIAGLREARKALEEIENRRKEIAEKNKPIEIRVKEANENTESKQAILNFYDMAISLAHEVETAINEQDYSKAVQNFDDYVATIEKEVKDLKEKSEQNPIDMKLKLAAEEKQKMLDELIQMRNGFISMGVTQIPFTIRMNYEKAKNGADAAKEGKDGMHWVEDMVSLAGGHWEADTPTVVKTSAEWQKELRKNLTAAKKELSDFEQGKGKYKDKKYTKEERDNERKRLDAAVSAAKKALGSDPTKRENKEENERIRRMKALQKFNDLLEKQKQDNARAAVDIQHSTTQAEIDAMEDGNDKTMRQIQLDFEKRKTEIERAYEDLKQKKIDDARKLWEANPANKDKVFDETTVDTSYTDAESKNYEALLKANETELARSLKAQTDMEKQALRDYMKEYGSLQEQRVAITAEYDQKIADSNDAIQKVTLRKQKERLIAELDMKEIQQSINWEVVFNDLDKLSTSSLKDLKEKLKAALDANDITPENAKVLSEKILETENLISDKTNIWGSMIPALRERQRLVNEVKNSEEQIADAQKRQTKAFFQATQAKDNLQSMAKMFIGRNLTREELNAQSGADLVNLLNASLDTFGVKINLTGNAAKKLSEAFDKNKIATTDLTKAQEEVTKAQKNGQYVNDLLKQMTGKGANGQNFGSALTSIFKYAAASNGGGFMGYASLIQQNVNSMADFTDKIGLAGTDFGDAVHGFQEGANGFMSAIQSLASGDVFGAVNGVIDGLAGFGKSLTSVFGINWSGGNEEEHAKTEEELITANEGLQRSIDKLREAFNNVNGIRAIELSEDIIKKQQEFNDNVMARWENDMRYHSAHHSNDANWEGFTSEQIGSMNDLLSRMDSLYGDAKDRSGNTARINSSSWRELSNLTPEALEYIRAYLPDVWDFITSRGNYSWVYDSLNEYADLSGKIAEQTKALDENLTQLSESSLHDQFLSELMDMEKKAKDFGDDFTNILAKAVLNAQIGDLMDEDLKKWRENLAKMMKKQGGLTNEDVAALRDQWDSIVQSGLEARDTMANITGYAKYEQEASSKGFQAMGQDVGAELNGRFTAVQIAGENISSQMLVVVATLNSIASFNQSSNTAAIEIRDMLIFTNSYLEDMVKYAKLLYNDFGEKLDDIVKNTK